MRIGYACKVEGIQGMGMKSCILKTMNDETLDVIITHNLEVLKKLLEYNKKHGISMFRISSDIIPLASHPAFSYEWEKRFADVLKALGNFAKASDIRLSMHPGQYTILNSPNKEAVSKAIADLTYHCAFLDALGMDASHKLILHIGGIYGDKEAAIARFIKVYQSLAANIKQRLIIENDDRFFTIADVYKIGVAANIPVVFDNLHHLINHDDTNDDAYWIAKCASTWQRKDGKQKLHYSQQARNKRIGAHSKTINSSVFLTFLDGLTAIDVDIMLEVKDKNISAMKCMQCINPTAYPVSVLEKEWANYKYAVMEYKHQNYLRIRELLKDKSKYPSVAFYRFVDEALAQQNPSGLKNAAEHIWGYFRGKATAKEKQRFFELLALAEVDLQSCERLKKFLFRLAKKYEQTYLIGSYFFVY